MNKKWFNNKYNIIYHGGDEFPISTPKNCTLYFGDLNSTAFSIRTHELEKDEVFNGNLIIKNKKVLDEYNIKDILKLPIDDNSIYVKNYVNSPHAINCSVDDSILYCGSFIFWMLCNYRNNYSLYANLRRNQILLKRIGDYL
tara:strand:+ start:182 stop:607 length:426 start_codon:yes stop_codon:yes gene_type:complete